MDAAESGCGAKGGQLDVDTWQGPAEGRCICEMSTRRKSRTGLPMTIWVNDTQAYVDGGRGKVVRFQLDTGEPNPFFCGEMGLDGEIREPRGPIPGLSASDILALRIFVHNNREALEHLADMEMDVLDVWPFVIKGVLQYSTLL